MKKAKPYLRHLNRQLLINIYYTIVKPHCTPYTTVHTCDVFSDLDWSTLAHNRKVQKAIMMHKIMNGNSPSYLSEMFEKQSGSTIL